MISLEFDINQPQNNLDFHKIDEGMVIVAHNGYSYCRILYPFEHLDRIINKIQQIKNETESTQLDSTN
jgi:hypothetical protein